MKARSVTFNNRRRGFDVEIGSKTYWFPYGRLEAPPTSTDPVVSVRVDPEIGREGFTYSLRSGQEGTVLVDQVLHYNKDPRLLRNLLLFELTVEAQRRVESSPFSKREIIRRLGTSAAQFYRLLDQTRTTKSVDQLLTLFSVLDCDVEVSVRAKGA
jgi:hypothetical protein